MPCDNTRKLTIEGKTYRATYDATQFPIRDGSIIEYAARGNEAVILGLQAELLEVRTSGQPLFEGGAMNIRTAYDPPPIPVRSFDWSAVDDATYDGPGSAIGYGSTEQEAVTDLLEQLEAAQ